jgi:hypothetical protein
MERKGLVVTMATVMVLAVIPAVPAHAAVMSMPGLTCSSSSLEVVVHSNATANRKHSWTGGTKWEYGSGYRESRTNRQSTQFASIETAGVINNGGRVCAPRGA